MPTPAPIPPPRLALPAVLFACLLLLAGCAEEVAEHRRYVPRDAFSIGMAGDYRSQGVDERFRGARGVFIVTFGDMVVALSSACPVDGHDLYFDPMPQQFRCPHCAARFDSNGLPRAPDSQKRGMPRLRIEPVDKAAVGDAVELRINPRFRFLFEHNDWSQPFSMHVLE